MKLREGSQVLGRFTVGAALPPQGELLRYAATDEAGASAELVVAGPRAALRDASGERARTAGRLPVHPAVLPATLGDVEGRPARVRVPVTPWPPATRLDPAQASAVLAWLTPAVMAAGAALDGVVTADDLVLDSAGVPRISPSGLVRERSLARLPVHEAPEGGRASPGAAALYGLGALLFEAVTGQAHVSAANLGDLAAARQRPMPARQARPDLPDPLARLLDALVHPDPAVRLQAAAALPPPVAPPTLQLAPALSAPPTLAPVATTRSTPHSTEPAVATSPSRDVALDDWVVLFDPAESTDGARRRLAALLDVPVAALEGRGPRVVAHGRTEDAALDRLGALESAGAALRVTRRPRGRAGPMVVLLAALLCGLAALALPSPLTPFAIGGAVGLLVGANVAMKRAGPSDLKPSEVARAWSSLQAQIGAQDDGHAHPEARRAVRHARAALLQADLADAMRVDLLEGLDDLDAQLDGLSADGDAAPVIGAAEAVAQAASTRAADGPSDATDAVLDRARAAARALGQRRPT